VKGVPFSGWRYVNGLLLRELRYVKRCRFSKFGMSKGADFRNLVYKNDPISQYLECERVGGPDLEGSIPV